MESAGREIFLPLLTTPLMGDPNSVPPQLVPSLFHSDPRADNKQGYLSDLTRPHIHVSCSPRLKVKSPFNQNKTVIISDDFANWEIIRNRSYGHTVACNLMFRIVATEINATGLELTVIKCDYGYPFAV